MVPASEDAHRQHACTQGALSPLWREDRSKVHERTRSGRARGEGSDPIQGGEVSPVSEDGATIQPQKTLHQRSPGLATNSFFSVSFL